MKIILCALLLFFIIIQSTERNTQKELNSLYKKALSVRDKKEIIEEIKTFHNNHNISYNEKYYVEFIFPKKNPSYGEYPLHFALANDMAFSLFLLNNKEVEVVDRPEDFNSMIHYLVPSIVQSGFTKEHNDILTILVKRGSHINTINSAGHTPLSKYIHTSKTVDPTVLRTFFNHGAQILNQKTHVKDITIFMDPYTRTKTSIKACNLLSTIITLHSPDPCKMYITSPEIVTLMTALFNERLYDIKEQYLNCLCCFSLLNKERNSNKLYKIPKPLIHLIFDITIQESKCLVDLKKGVANLNEIKKKPKNQDYTIGLTYNQIKKSKDLYYNQEICAMGSLVFWNRPIKKCLEDLDSIIHKKQFYYK